MSPAETRWGGRWQRTRKVAEEEEGGREGRQQRKKVVEEEGGAWREIGRN